MREMSTGIWWQFFTSLHRVTQSANGSLLPAQTPENHRHSEQLVDDGLSINTHMNECMVSGSISLDRKCLNVVGICQVSKL